MRRPSVVRLGTRSDDGLDGNDRYVTVDDPEAVAALSIVPDRFSMLAVLWASSALACSAGSQTPQAPRPAERRGFYCLEVRPEPGVVTALCKRTLEDCRVAREGELGAGAFAGECQPRGEAYCMSYALASDGETRSYSMCMSDRAGCDALREQARRDGASRVDGCTLEH